MIAPGKGGYIFRGFEFRGSSIRCTAYRKWGGRQRSITPPQDVPCIYATKIPIELLRLCITKAPHLCSAFRHALFLIYNAFVLPKYPSFAKITYFFVAPHLIIIAPHLNLKKRCGARKIFARSATQLFKILCTPLLWRGVNQRFLGRKLKYNLSSRLDLSSFRQCRGRGCKKRSLRKKIRPFLGTRFRPHPLPSNFKKVFSVPLDLKFGL